MMEAEEKAFICQQAEECRQTGRYQEALHIYCKLIAHYPAEEPLLLSLAWAYHDAGCQDKAIQCFEQLFDKELSRKVFTGFAYDELVRIYKTSEQYDRLVEVCERAVAAQPDDTMLLGELGAAYLKARLIEKSRDVCHKIIALEPDSAATYCLLGETHLAAGEFASVEKAFNRAAQIDPEAACSVHSRLAAGYGRVGEHKRAERSLRKCLKIRPREPLYYCRVGDCLIWQGTLAAARTAYETAVALFPASADVFYHRWAYTLAAAQYHQEAIAVLRCALEKGLNNPRYRIGMAESYAALGMTDMAVQVLAEVQP